MRKRVRFVSTHGEELDILADAITATTKTAAGTHVHALGTWFEVDEGEYRHVRTELRQRRLRTSRRARHAS